MARPEAGPRRRGPRPRGDPRGPRPPLVVRGRAGLRRDGEHRRRDEPKNQEAGLRRRGPTLRAVRRRRARDQVRSRVRAAERQGPHVRGHVPARRRGGGAARRQQLSVAGLRAPEHGGGAGGRGVHGKRHAARPELARGAVQALGARARRQQHHLLHPRVHGDAHDRVAHRLPRLYRRQPQELLVHLRADEPQARAVVVHERVRREELPAAGLALADVLHPLHELCAALALRDDRDLQLGPVVLHQFRLGNVRRHLRHAGAGADVQHERGPRNDRARLLGQDRDLDAKRHDVPNVRGGRRLVRRARPPVVGDAGGDRVHRLRRARPRDDHGRLPHGRAGEKRAGRGGISRGVARRGGAGRRRRAARAGLCDARPGGHHAGRVRRRAALRGAGGPALRLRAEAHVDARADARRRRAPHVQGRGQHRPRTRKGGRRGLRQGGRARRVTKGARRLCDGGPPDARVGAARSDGRRVRGVPEAVARGGDRSRQGRRPRQIARGGGRHGRARPRSRRRDRDRRQAPGRRAGHHRGARQGGHQVVGPDGR
mmetsp:Transcript_2285/g.6513  ORF Transcript_2285/g.6513 Transcript_2285/m.6513 type:complete len:543 (+) Transcript_2285:569-2197(+)